MHLLFESILKSEKANYFYPKKIQFSNQTYTIRKIKNLIFYLEYLKGISYINCEIYSIGVFSNPKKVTVSNQQYRSVLFAEAFYNQKIMKSNKDVFNILIIGAGILGITAALKLFEYNKINKKKIKITIFEKAPYLCHIQRGCKTRRISPFIHRWPNSSYLIENPKIKDQSVKMIYELLYKNTYLRLKKNVADNSIVDWSSDYAGNVIDKFVDKIIRYANNKNLNIYENVSDLRIKYDDSVNVSFVGERIKNASGIKDDLTYYPQIEFDSIIFATGFGIEKDLNIIENNKLNYIGNSYWRNDDFGQTILNTRNSNFLISGNGDGAINEFLRLKILNYDPEKIIQHLFYKKNKTNEQLVVNPLVRDVLDDLVRLKSDNGSIVNYFENPKNSGPHREKISKFFNHIYNKLIPLIIREITIVFIILNKKMANDLELITDNSNSFFYNRLLFYFTWRASLGIHIKSTVTTITKYDDIKDILLTYNIPDKHIIIRHGTDKLKSIESIFKNSNFIKLDNNLFNIKNKLDTKSVSLYINGIEEINMKEFSKLSALIDNNYKILRNQSSNAGGHASSRSYYHPHKILLKSNKS